MIAHPIRYPMGFYRADPNRPRIARVVSCRPLLYPRPSKQPHRRHAPSGRLDLAMNEHEIDRIADAWLWVPNYEGTYRVSELGQVWSTPRPTTAGGLLKWNLSDPHGYPRVTLVQDGKQWKFRVHILVARAFLGEPAPGLEVRHLNGDSSDPRLSNLAYGTHRQNALDASRHGALWMTHRTHCPQGHPYDRENTILSQGRRKCRACAHSRFRRWPR